MSLTTSKTEQRQMSTCLPAQHQATTILETKVPTTTKTTRQDKPVNVSIMLHGPVSKEQLYKIQGGTKTPITVPG